MVKITKVKYSERYGVSPTLHYREYTVKAIKKEVGKLKTKLRKEDVQEKMKKLTKKRLGKKAIKRQKEISKALNRVSIVDTGRIRRMENKIYALRKKQLQNKINQRRASLLKKDGIAPSTLMR